MLQLASLPSNKGGSFSKLQLVLAGEFNGLLEFSDLMRFIWFCLKYARDDCCGTDAWFSSWPTEWKLDPDMLKCGEENRFEYLIEVLEVIIKNIKNTIDYLHILRDWLVHISGSWWVFRQLMVNLLLLLIIIIPSINIVTCQTCLFITSVIIEWAIWTWHFRKLIISNPISKFKSVKKPNTWVDQCRFSF